MRDNLTEYQRQHIIEMLERGRELPHVALGGQRSKAPRVRSSPERDFALFDTGFSAALFAHRRRSRWRKQGGGPPALSLSKGRSFVRGLPVGP